MRLSLESEGKKGSSRNLFTAMYLSLPLKVLNIQKYVAILGGERWEIAESGNTEIRRRKRNALTRYNDFMIISEKSRKKMT